MAGLWAFSGGNIDTSLIVPRFTSKSSAGGTLTIDPTGGRRGGPALKGVMSGSGGECNVKKTLATPAPGDNKCILAVGFVLSGLPNTPGRDLIIATLAKGGIPQVLITVGSDACMRLYRGNGSTLGGGFLIDTSSPITVGVYTQFEIELSITSSAAYEMRFNGGSSVMSGSGANLQTSAGAGYGELWLGAHSLLSSFAPVATGVYFEICDVRIADGTGSYNNTFIGDTRVDWRGATAEGANTQGTVTGAANHAAAVNSVPPVNTKYVTLATVGHKYTNEMQDAPVSGAPVFWTQTVKYGKKSDTGTCTVTEVITSGGTDYVGSDIAPSTSEGFMEWAAREVDPDTSVPWDTTGIGAVQVGTQKTA